MLNPRRTVLARVLRHAAALTLAATCGWAAAADNAKPIKLLVGFPPGGGSDAVARLLADKLKDEMGVTFVVENRPGAGGQIAAQALKAAPADGTVLFLSHDHTISILPLVTKNPGFDPAHDFVPVAGFASFVNAFAVSSGTPAKSFKEYVSWVQTQNGGKGAVGIPAPASTPEFLVKLVAEKYSLDLIAAPYRGSGPMIADMLGNQISAGIGSVPDFVENHKAGKLRVVAVLGKNRQAVMPEVPTFSELGLGGLEDLPYYGIFAPAGTPKAFIDQFNHAIAKVLALHEVQDSMTKMGLNVNYMNAQQLAQREHAYTQVWTRLIKSSGFQPQ